MRGLALLYLLCWCVPPALAQSDAGCPEGNLLQKARITSHRGVKAKHFPRLTDGAAPKEGDHWNTNRVVVLKGASARLTWDLGEARRIERLLIQADNNDTYRFETSADGKQWTALWTAPRHNQPGMRVRTRMELKAEARYLRLVSPKGDDAYSVGELGAWCAAPAVWPPKLKRKKGKRNAGKEKPRRRNARRKLLMAGFGLLVFCALLLGLRSEDAPEVAPSRQTVLAVVLLLFACGSLTLSAYVNWVWSLLGLLAVYLASILLRGGGFERYAPWLSWIGTTGATVSIAWYTFAWPGVILAGGLSLSWLLYLLGLARGRAPLVVVGALGAVGLALYGGYFHNEGGGGRKWSALVVAAAAAASAYCMWRVRAKGAPGWRLVAERAALVGLVFAGLGAWTNFGRYHGSRVIHYWDSFHYYAGSKYFAENRYTRLYHCAAIAEVDDGRRKEMDKRKLRDLRDNSLGPLPRILPEDELCRRAFGDARWEAFRQDLRLFRSYMGAKWFKDMFMDHGYNATPVWTMVGHWISNANWRAAIPPEALRKAPIYEKGAKKAARKAMRERFKADRLEFQTSIRRIAAIDGALYLCIFGAIFWAFGLRALAMAALIFGIGYPWDFHFTGGAMGRVPWLWAAVLGMCFMKKGFSGLGGAGITLSALLRGFPAALMGGVALKIADTLIRERTITPAHRRLIIACTITLGGLVAASSAATGGIGVYQEFWENTVKHKETRLTNHMGLPTLLSYHPAHSARFTKNSKLDDPFAVWKQRRIQNLHARAPLKYAIYAALFLLIGLLSRRLEDWELTALSTVFIIALFELTCYYYNFILMLAPFALKRPRYAVFLIGTACATQLVHLNIGWYDVQYTVESLTVFLGVLLLILDEAFDLGGKGDAAVQRVAGDLLKGRPDEPAAS